MEEVQAHSEIAALLPPLIFQERPCGPLLSELAPFPRPPA